MMFLAVIQIVLLIVMLATALYVANILDQWRAEWHTSFVVDDGDTNDDEPNNDQPSDDC